MRTGLLGWLARLNGRHPWSHNDHYGPWVARRVAGARDVLDVGCGTGNLIDRLRRRAVTVTGLEPDAVTASVAAQRFADTETVTVVQTDFAGRDRRRRWDAVTMVAVLHHLPLTSTLRELRDACLAPGGRLVVVGCFRTGPPFNPIVELAAMVANPVVGLVKHPGRAVAPPVHMTAPTAEPKETLAEIRAVVARELPGARVRRRLFWRYTLVYTAPPAAPPAVDEAAG